MDWTAYQETYGKRQQERMREMLKGIENPTLEQIQAAADSNYPFSDSMRFCSRHTRDSDVIEVTECVSCYAHPQKHVKASLSSLIEHMIIDPFQQSKPCWL